MTKIAATMGILAIFMAGCAANQQPESDAQATHYWESTATKRQYSADHAACEQSTKVDANGELDANSASFEAYRDCMIGQGYTLRTY